MHVHSVRVRGRGGRAIGGGNPRNALLELGGGGKIANQKYSMANTDKIIDGKQNVWLLWHNVHAARAHQPLLP